MRFILSEALTKESLVKTDYLDDFVLVQQAGGEERPEGGAEGRVNISVEN